MVDWREAGRKADAHLVRDLYRAQFANPAKNVARERVIEAMRLMGVQTILDLWGGGHSAKAFAAAGFRVIAVDDGSMLLRDHAGRPISRARKRRALEYAAAEDGYEARFGKAEKFAHEADGAFLDFCGPWAAHVRRAVSASRHMKCVAVTLVPDHDLTTDATNNAERRWAYQIFLTMAWSGSQTATLWKNGRHVRRLTDYRRARGQLVFVYTLSSERLTMSPISKLARFEARPDKRQAAVEYRAERRRDPLIRERRRHWDHSRRTNARRRMPCSFCPPPEPVTPEQEARRDYQRHWWHTRGSRPRTPCPFCHAGTPTPSSRAIDSASAS